MPFRERATDFSHSDGLGRLRLPLCDSAQETAAAVEHGVGMIDDDKVGGRFRTDRQQPVHRFVLSSRSEPVGKHSQRDRGRTADTMVAVDEQRPGHVFTCKRDGTGDLIPARHADAAIVPIDVLEVEHEMRRMRVPVKT